MLYFLNLSNMTVLLLILIIVYLFWLYFYRNIKTPQELITYFRDLWNKFLGLIYPDESTKSEEYDSQSIKINIFDNQYLSEGGRHIDYLVVPLGQRIVWENLDSAYHTVTHLQNQNFNSGNLKLNDLYDFTFDQPGRYWVYCRLHPKNMIHINVLNANGKSVPHTFDQYYSLEQPFNIISPPEDVSKSCKDETSDYMIRPYPLLENYPPVKLTELRFASGPRI